MKAYDVPAEQIRLETRVINSRFIASLAPSLSVEEARSFIQIIRDEFKDASHHVPAFLIGHGESEIAHCTDAGEPSGTAGKPMLAVLRGSGLGDVVVVVTRYFGGTKLGTGGLVRAYSEAIRGVVEKVPRARKTWMHTLMLAYPYAYVERIRRLATAHAVDIVNETFETDVTLTGRILPEDLMRFQAEVLELTNGSVQVAVVETGNILKRISP